MGEDRHLDDGEHLEVRFSERGVRLVLRRNRGRLLAEFDAPGVSAATEVYLLGRCDGLGHFWCELAEDWRGWEGARSWRSLEGDLELSATSDRLAGGVPGRRRAVPVAFEVRREARSRAVGAYRRPDAGVLRAVRGVRLMRRLPTGPRGARAAAKMPAGR